MALTLLVPLNLILASLNFIVFVWAIRSHFRRPDDGQLPRKMKLVSMMFTGLAILFFGALLLHPSDDIPFLATATLLLGLSQLIFQWAVRVNRQEPLPIAFSEQRPSYVRRSGPYRWVRHPFYLSYSLTWLAVPIATELWWFFIFSFPMIIGYYRTAKGEEDFLLRSPLGSDYREYQARTGMLLPNPFKR